MKISPYDKLQALKHSKQYAKDYEVYLKKGGTEFHPLHGSPETLSLDLPEPAIELCSKYAIRYPVNPYEPLQEWEIDFVCPKITFLEVQESWREVEKIDWSGNPRGQSIKQINGKLTIMIDPSYSESEILDAFRDFIQGFLIQLGRSKDRKRDSRSGAIDNIWEVYRKHKIEGESLLQITRSLFRIKGSQPAYDDELDKERKKVERAFRKACEIISQIERNPGC